ncbi:hypothetical protein [Iodobacter fluviatilis]|uniref:DUF4410 domain-containing protein n=1 Tax=Iodobacter fluviatilis TaxID=537 RepID=A0A377Q8Y5_9NEIS|nr:hypothetical protein [Iodobacter fluviatilis]TCU88587.1 hypothetical protein EV682_103171 [Iodobacter fluviatilis]STQ91342.1 Uncharacterised protein [Iodobacter fluviatilis]
MKLVIMLLMLGSATVMASEKTYLETPVLYLPDASVIKRVKEECNVEELLTKRVGSSLAHLNRAEGTVSADVTRVDGNVLRLRIARVTGVGGGGFSGPKSITVVAELLENGKVQRQSRLNRWSVGGFWGGFRGTCSILDRTAIAIGKDLARWVKDASYTIKEDADIKDDASAKENSEPLESTTIKNSEPAKTS